MKERGLLVAGVVAIAASLLIGTVVIRAGELGDAQTVSIDQARQSAQSFLNSTGDRDLKIDELMEFRQNYYVLIKEQSTGVGAFELLVNKSNGAVSFEPGPNMMWNTKYSMMGGGMMGRMRVSASVDPMPVDKDQATHLAQQWLDQNITGDAAGTPDVFYGYYTFHFERNGQVGGMLSVNGYSGQVWFHSWHGAFIQGRDFGA